MNLVILLFSFFLSLMLFLGIPCNMEWKWVPKLVTDIYLYGKTTDGRVVSRLVRVILVPKSWFSHFYAFASLYMCFVVFIVFLKFTSGISPTTSIATYVGFVASYDHNPLEAASPEVSLLAAILFFLHVLRRFYETLFIHVFSSAKMNLVHYISGILHYWGCCTVLLAYAADYSTQAIPITTSIKHIHAQEIFGIGLFLFAFYQQYDAHVILANMRKASKSKEQYVLPEGGMYNLVSCPNFLFEIIIYISIYLILGLDHYPWALITCWVSTNQILAAIMAHKWYKTKFENYPPSRKAIFPFLL